MNLNELVSNYLALGYELADAQSKVCQDLILYKIGKSKYAHNITVKGDVVMLIFSLCKIKAFYKKSRDRFQNLKAYLKSQDQMRSNADLDMLEEKFCFADDI